MSGTIVEMEASIHQRVQKLLAFDGALGTADAELVRQHVGVCLQCRDELAWQNRMKAVHPAAGAAPDMDAALARILPQLEPAAPAQPQPRPRAANWMAWALAAQFLVIAGLGLQMVRGPGEYRLLGNAAPAPAANLIVQFDAGIRERDMQALLAREGARIVDGPTVTRAWLLHVEPGRVEQAVRTLRANPQVSMAEPLQVGE